MELNSGPPGRQVGLKKHALQKILWTKIMDILSGRGIHNICLQMLMRKSIQQTHIGPD